MTNIFTPNCSNLNRQMNKDQKEIQSLKIKVSQLEEAVEYAIQFLENTDKSWAHRHAAQRIREISGYAKSKADTK